MLCTNNTLPPPSDKWTAAPPPVKCELHPLPSPLPPAEFWIKVAQATLLQLSNASVDGVVILHGSDTMEQTAWFLQVG